MALCFLAAACEDQQVKLEQQSLSFVGEWFAQASAGVRDDSLCHGLGTLKHPEISCAEMLEHASRVAADSREVTSLKPMDCFAGVCGEFVEITFSSRDQAGNPLDETALLKRDNGTLRMYWYRSDTLLGLLRSNDEEAIEAKESIQLAYDEMTTRYPSLYSYPPCYRVRPSSSTLVGELMEKDNMDVASVEQLADSCGEAFCFALVGNKIATLCPKSD